MERALEIAVDIDGFAVDKNIATAMNLQKQEDMNYLRLQTISTLSLSNADE